MFSCDDRWGVTDGAVPFDDIATFQLPPAMMGINFDDLQHFSALPSSSAAMSPRGIFKSVPRAPPPTPSAPRSRSTDTSSTHGDAVMDEVVMDEIVMDMGASASGECRAEAGVDIDTTAVVAAAPVSVDVRVGGYTCPFFNCPYSCQFGSDIVRHLFGNKHAASMRQIEPSFGYSCVVCHDVRFASYTALNAHRRAAHSSVSFSSASDHAMAERTQKRRNREFIDSVSTLVESANQHDLVWLDDALTGSVCSIPRPVSAVSVVNPQYA